MGACVIRITICVGLLISVKLPYNPKPNPNVSFLYVGFMSRCGFRISGLGLRVCHIEVYVLSTVHQVTNSTWRFMGSCK